jgi:signal transduction histidine kinase/ActR/RegA family two-component response regulator
MQTDRPRGEPDAAHARNAPAASALVITGAQDVPVFQRALESAGAGAFRVAVADGVGAALERLRRDPFDAVLLDLDLVDASGIESVGRVRELAGSAALIVTSGDPDLFRAVDLGADGWIASGDSAIALAGCVRGAVERRRLREELVESEARFCSIIERTADGIVIVGEDGRVRFVNPGAERLFGRSAAELVGQDFGLAVLAGETTEMDIVRNAESEPVVAELRVSATTWDGAAAQIISLRDITDRKRAEEKARELARAEAARTEAEAAARKIAFLAEAGAILASSLDYAATLNRLARLAVPFLADFCLVHVRDGEGELPQVAAAHRDPAGDELLRELGRRHRVDPESAGSMVARVVRTGTPELYPQVPGEVEAYVTPDREVRALWDALGAASLIVVPLAAHDHIRGTLTLVSSVSGRRYGPAELALAEELARRAALAVENALLYEEAQAASLAKSNFLAVMSHELRTPLNAVIGYTDLMEAEIPGPLTEAQRHNLERIKGSSAHLLHIVEEILTFTRMETNEQRVHLEQVELLSLLRGAAALVEPLAAQKELALGVRVPETPVEMETDPAKVRQILVNLLGNAVKFTDRGEVELSAEVAGGEVVVQVRDTGIGIPPEHLERIWEPFWQVEQTTTRAAEGTGLGLSVARRLARLLRGDLTVESTPGEGSTFTVRLPLAAPKTVPVPSGVLLEPSADGASREEEPSPPNRLAESAGSP